MRVSFYPLAAPFLVLAGSCAGPAPKPAVVQPREAKVGEVELAPVGEATSLEEQIRDRKHWPDRFQATFDARQAAFEEVLIEPLRVPVPKDPGGGYTHERHKKNYAQMFLAGQLFQLTGDKKYASFVGDMLISYAKLYPTLPVHPQKRNRNKGKLFWQGLNESVWLVHTIQAYEAVRDELTHSQRQTIEDGVLRPMALFLSVQSPETFDRIHNHATWSTAAVGMAGYVLGEEEWVKRALLGLDGSGKKGFLRQLDELFSPDGYYNEGPYYQRYALLPFVTFASYIDRHEPKRRIFEHRDSVLLKAISTTIELSYAGLFFPLNDAIKSKGIETNELVTGVTIAYARTRDPRLLDIATQQDKTLLSRDGFLVARDIESGRSRPYAPKSRVFSDGPKGASGALVVLRKRTAQETPNEGRALVFKATSQGGGHGHFDKMGWQLYDRGSEVISDYGAARFLNVEAKDGGRYLPENTTWAKQTIAHNALVVDQTSHFGGDATVAEEHHPVLQFFENSDEVTITRAAIDSAYQGTNIQRTMALLELEKLSLVVDIVRVESDRAHTYDLPLHYVGHFMEANFPFAASQGQLRPLGSAHGYEHLWLRAKAQPKQPLSKLTWLNENGRFYTYSTLGQDGDTVFFTQLGANDPHFNLRDEQAFIFRSGRSKAHEYISVLEAHGEYNPAQEYTLGSKSRVTGLQHKKNSVAEALVIELADEAEVALLWCTKPKCPENESTKITVDGQERDFKGRVAVKR